MELGCLKVYLGLNLTNQTSWKVPIAETTTTIDLFMTISNSLNPLPFVCIQISDTLLGNHHYLIFDIKICTTTKNEASNAFNAWNTLDHSHEALGPVSPFLPFADTEK